MIDTNAVQPELRTNQATTLAVPTGAARMAAMRSASVRPAARAATRTPAAQIASAERPNLLARVARAARQAVDDVRHSGDVPLPHLYRGRDFEQRRDAA
jgi:hypothetical protein